MTYEARPMQEDFEHIQDPTQDLRCLAIIHPVRCECGNHWTEISFIFKHKNSGYSYDLSSERYAALCERTLIPCGQFVTERRVPVCAGCLGRLPSGWPEYRDRNPDNLPHDFRWREPIARKPTAKPSDSEIKDQEQSLINKLLFE